MVNYQVGERERQRGKCGKDKEQQGKGRRGKARIGGGGNERGWKETREGGRKIG